jgi:signal peptidase II
VSGAPGARTQSGGLTLKRDNLNAALLPCVAGVVLLLDQVSKHIVVSQLERGQSWEITAWLTHVFQVTHVTNTGAVFGLFPQLGNYLILVSAAVILVIVGYSRGLPVRHRAIRTVLGLQMGGAVGNLIDRLRRGYVVDFIDVNFWPFQDFAVFNRADASIVVGVAVLVLLMALEERRERGARLAANAGPLGELGA